MPTDAMVDDVHSGEVRSTSPSTWPASRTSVKLVAGRLQMDEVVSSAAVPDDRMVEQVSYGSNSVARTF